MAVTETTSKSWFDRIKDSIKGIVLGLIMIPLGIGLLFWNEGRTVKMKRDLNEGQSQVQTINPETPPTNLPENNIVHFSGKTVLNDSIIDPVFGVTVLGLHLERSVEMYQWVENVETKTEKKLGGSEETTKTYTYSKEWKSTLTNSSNFKEEGHNNPSSMPFKSEDFMTSSAQVGSIDLSSETIGGISCYADLNLRNISFQDTAIKNLGHELYIGQGTTTTPQIGDVRVTFRYVPATDVSIVSSLANGTTAPYLASEGNPILLTQCGNISSTAMFKTAQESNALMGWLLRLLGFILIFIGFRSIFKILSVLADVVPFIGSLVGGGMSIIAFLLTSGISLITISIAWIFYRPILGICLLLLGIGAAVAIFFFKKKNSEESGDLA